MDDLTDKLEELKGLRNDYKKWKESLEKATILDLEEAKKILSRIKEVEMALPTGGFAIRDAESFFERELPEDLQPYGIRYSTHETILGFRFRDSKAWLKKHRLRYFLLKTETNEIRVQVYEGEERRGVDDPKKCDISILRPLNERLPKFVDVVIAKTRDAIK